MGPEEHNLVKSEERSPAKEEQPPNMEAQWGVGVSTVRLTGADYFLDFRYRVLDPKKAAPLLDKNNKPVLIHQETGMEFPVQASKIGPVRSTAVQPKADRQYTVLFSNGNKTIKRGNKVTVVIGEFKAKDLTVQ
jgi:hypothetical protein